MKSTRYLVLFILIAAPAWAQRTSATTPQSDAPNVSSPIGQKPTGIPADGAYERPRTRINSANDIITGNVAGGREFRGTLPYNSQSQLSTGLSDPGSSSVRSFLRRSSGSPYVPLYGDSSKPYYDPMQTTTGFRPGELSGLSRPVITTPSNIARVSVPQWTDLQRISQPQRPAWQETTELESVVMQQMGLRELALMEEQLSKLDPAQVERLNPRLRQFLEPTEEPAKTGREKPNPLYDESVRPVQPDKPVEPGKLTEAERLRIEREQIEQMRKELESLLEPESATTAKPKPRAETKTETKTESPSQAKPAAESKSALPPLPPRSSEKPQTPAAEPDKPAEPAEKPFRLPSPEQRTRIRQLLGPYKNFEVLIADKTADYIKQGDQFMVKRQYYRAADAYTLAAVWQSNDPQIYLKQSFALFAAGAYLSGAQSLQQALYLKPELAGEKNDPLEKLGGVPDSTKEKSDNKQIYDSRMKEVVVFRNRSDSGMLALLMSYLYYQIGDMDNARTALNNTKIVDPVKFESNFPNDPAITAMKNVLFPDAAPSKAKP
jgi:tetratricopeptide (TPR) repeat protein